MTKPSRSGQTFRTIDSSTKTPVAAGLLLSLGLIGQPISVLDEHTGDMSYIEAAAGDLRIETSAATSLLSQEDIGLLPHPLAVRESEWLKFLFGLVDAGYVSESQVSHVRAFWEELKNRIGRPLRLPITMPAGDGSIQLAWSTKEHYLDIDMFADGSYEWFYRNRFTDELDGTENERCTALSAPLLALIDRVA